MSALEPILIASNWHHASNVTGQFRAENPATGEAIYDAFPVSGTDDIETALSAGRASAAELAATPPERIAAFLEAYTVGTGAAASELVAFAHVETALAEEPRLAKLELPRTTGQMRDPAAATRSYNSIHPIIDTAAGIRSHLAPLGKPVMIFGPNKFPYAFSSIAGSDLAADIAARNPVIAKVHPSHPRTSQRLVEIAHEAVKGAGLPAAPLQMLVVSTWPLGWIYVSINASVRPLLPVAERAA